MQLFDCRVRVGGQISHEVPKECVTEMEVNVLRHIHGADAVAGFKKHGSVDRDKDEEINRLVGEYGADKVSAALNVVVNTFAPIVESEDDLTLEQAAAVEQPAEQPKVDPVADRMKNPK